ncbi:MAG: S-layer homology domain-containing protein [Firmicutes bacterium]|nr:S-layer homology domain-containing protein [Bacillota bacterium]
MTSKLNKLLLLLLAAALIFSLATATALAADYPVWVGSTQVTSSNMNDVLGDGKVSFDPSTQTLTFNEATVTDTHTGMYVCIYSDGQDLTVKGKVTVSGQQYGIYVEGAKLTIDGDVTVTGAQFGIEAIDVEIKSGNVNVTGSSFGIGSRPDSGGSITISGGTVTATGDDYGILASKGTVTVSGDSTQVTAKGGDYGIYAKTGINITNPLAVVEPASSHILKVLGEGGYFTIADADENVAKTVVIKNPGSTTATYTLKGLTASGTGYSYISMMNSVIPTFSDKTPVWGGADPGTSAIRYTDSAFFTDASETTALKVDPVEGETYYFYFTISNNTENDHSIDFSKVDSTQVNVTLSGFTVEYLNAETEVQAGCDSVLLHFSATKDATPAATHTVTVNNGKAYDESNTEITSAAPGDTVNVKLDRDNVPAGKYYDTTNAPESNPSLIFYRPPTAEPSWSFTMPDKDVTVTFNLSDATPYTIDVSSGSATVPNEVAEALWGIAMDSNANVDGEGAFDIHIKWTPGSAATVTKLDTATVTDKYVQDNVYCKYTPVTYQFAKLVETIDWTIEEPVVGATPATSAAVDTVPAEALASSSVGLRWEEGTTNDYLSAGEMTTATFEEGKYYFAVPDNPTISFNDGYSKDYSSTIGRVNGKNVSLDQSYYAVYGPLTASTTYTVTVNNGKAYDGPGAAGQVITKAAEGDKVYVRFPDITIPEGKYVAGYTSEQVGQQRYDELTDGIVLNFTMPAKDVVLDAILEDQTDLVVDLTDGTEAYASGPFSLLYNSLYSAAGQGLIDLDDSGSQRLVDLDQDSNNDIIINGADDAIDLHSECNIKGELTVLNINYGAYKSITFKFKMFDGDLPVVNGATINFTDVTEDGDGYKLNTDGAEKAIFADSEKTASITFEVNPLYEDQAMTTKLTAAPESGVPVYFIVGLEAYEDKDPLEPTVEWAANATIMAQSQLTAENGEIEIVEISHSPAGGTLSLICKYTAAAPATYTVTYKVVNGTWSDGTKDEITETVAEGEKPANVPTGMKAASGYSDGKWDTDPDSAAISEDTTFTYTFTKKSSGGSSGGSGSGGNSSSAAKEEVNVADSENGDVSVDPEEAKKGQTVTVTAEPDPGYEVDEVKVTDEDGKEVPVTDNGDGTYSFKMPDGPVDVAVTFKDKDGFSDVGPNDWFYDEVLYAVDNGLMNGVGGGKFAPNDPTTRAMIVTILYRLEGSPAVSEAAPFSDVAAGQWYADAVAWASANDIVKGFPDGTFKPDELITREQFVTILYRYAQFKGYDVSVGEDTNILSFNDALEVSDWANAAVCWAVGAGLMQGDDQGNLNPQAPASRAEAAALFQRFAEKVK